MHKRQTSRVHFLPQKKFDVKWLCREDEVPKHVKTSLIYPDVLDSTRLDIVLSKVSSIPSSVSTYVKNENNHFSLLPRLVSIRTEDGNG